MPKNKIVVIYQSNAHRAFDTTIRRFGPVPLRTPSPKNQYSGPARTPGALPCPPGGIAWRWAAILAALMFGGAWRAGLQAADPLRGQPVPERITVANWNLEWFYDHYRGDNRSDTAKQQSAPTAADWEWKLNEVAAVIARLKPTILCLQEVEGRDAVWALTRVLRDQHELNYRIAFIPGFDFYTEQNVAIIYLGGLVEFSRREQTPEMYDSELYYNLNKHLFARFEWGQGAERQSLWLVTTHLRATPEGVEFRKRQARLLRYWLEPAIAAGENVAVVGDINTEEDFGTETADGEMAVLRGLSHPPELQLADVHQYLPGDLRVTHISGRQYDRVLISPRLLQDDPQAKDLSFSRAVVRRDLVVRGAGVDAEHFDSYWAIDAAERDISDHYPLMAEFEVK